MFRNLFPSKGKAFVFGLIFGLVGYVLLINHGDAFAWSFLGVGIWYFAVWLMKLLRDMSASAGTTVQRTPAESVQESVSEQPRKGRYYVPEND